MHHCTTGQLSCADECVDVQTSTTHCGSCNAACSTGQTCEAGSCQPVCSTGLTDCGGTCVDLTSSPKHCGACNTACTGDEVCSESQCSTDCSGDLTNCSGSCVDLNSSSTHCGQCGTSCNTTTETCTNGACVCLDDFTECDDSCVNLQTDESHCGSCDNACAAGESCDGGTCLSAPTCDASWANCTEASFDATDKTGETGTINIDLVPFQLYSPPCLKLKVGQTVTIGATSSHPFKKQCAEDSVMDAQNGQTSNVTFTLETPGYYNYRCQAHATMKGNIKVIP